METEEDEALGALDAAAVYAALFLEGLSYGEIAAVVGVPVGMIRSQLHHGRRALRREMKGLRRSDDITKGGDR